jgi:hypothetical protein
MLKYPLYQKNSKASAASSPSHGKENATHGLMGAWVREISHTRKKQLSSARGEEYG